MGDPENAATQPPSDESAQPTTETSDASGTTEETDTTDEVGATEPEIISKPIYKP